MPGSQLVLRPACADDVDRLRDWRNDPDAVRFSASRREVSRAEHRRWLAERLSDPGTRLWIAEVDGAAVGQVRVDTADGTGTVSIAIAGEHRGHGWGQKILEAMVVAVTGSPNVRELRALVDPGNAASVRVFEHAGFRRESASERGFLVFVRSTMTPPTADATP